MKTKKIFLAMTLTGIFVFPIGKGLGWAQNVAINTTGAAAAATNFVEVLQPSTTASSVGIYSLHSGIVIGTGYAGYFSKTGASTTNVAGYFSATGATNNYAGIFENGRVGIGTISPTTALDIRNPNVVTASTTVGNLNVMTTNAQAIDVGSAISLGGMYDDAAVTFRVFGTIEGRKFNGTTASSSGYLAFKTNNAGTLTERLRIDFDGNVGIGTTTPTNILSLGNTAAQKIWIENTVAGTVGRALTVAAGGTVAGTADITGGNLILQAGLGTGTGASTISFQTGTTLTTGTTLQTMSTKMTILGSGNIGIGTTLPGTSRLYVNIPNTDATNETGLTVQNSYSGTAAEYGIINNVSTDGSGVKYGIYNTVNGLAADLSTNYGIYNYNVPNGTGTDYAMYNYISGVGTGARYGLYTDVNTAISSTSSTYGQYTTMDNDGTGGSYGLYITSIGSTTGTEYGLYITGEDRSYFSNVVSIGTTTPTATRLECYDPSVGTVRVAIFKNNAASGTEIQVGSIELLHDYSSTTDFNNGVNTVGLSINLAASASYDLHLANNSAGKPTSSSWTIASDARLKEDIHPFMDGLDVLRSINPIYFKYNGKAKMPDEYGIGVIAQDMMKVAPYTVGTFEYMPDENNPNSIEEYYSYNADALHYITLNAVKELDSKQTQMETIVKNITDFGAVNLNAFETSVTYNAEFVNLVSNGSYPLVTVTAVNSDAQVSIIEQNNKGFTVRSSKGNEPVQINWIAIAKVKENIYNTNTQYSETDRQDMLNKVKLRAAHIRNDIEYENTQLQLRNKEEKK